MRIGRSNGARPACPATRLVRRCFTLIELLVVIAIIALLASMLLPGMNRARQRTHRTVCLGHLHQASIAAHLYAEEFDEWLPPVSTVVFGRPRLYSDLLSPYVTSEEVWTCPRGDREPVRMGSRTGVLLHYGVNRYDYDNMDGDWINDHLPGLNGQCVRRVATPDEVIYLADSDPANSPEDIGALESGTRRWPLNSLEASRHGGGYCAVMLGGSAVWRRSIPNHGEWAVKAR